MTKALIREIFLSIQGEGPFVGEEQLFIRFCGCNLNCAYCDTDFEPSKAKLYTPQELLETINTYGKELTISLTGGEPLISVEFLKKFLPLAKTTGHSIYLETNSTLPKELTAVIEYIDIISADIKLPSATNETGNLNDIEQFFKIASCKETFAKLVFNKNITANEIDFAVKLAQENNIEIILQPEMNGNKFCLSTEEMETVFKSFHEKYKRVRLIPQMHKFMNVR